MVWIALSSSVILQNAYILRTMQFNYPIALTTWCVSCPGANQRTGTQADHLSASGTWSTQLSALAYSGDSPTCWMTCRRSR